LALVVEVMMLRALTSGVGLALMFDIMFGICALMVALHIDGAVRRIQPITETLEIGLWLLLLLGTVLFYPATVFVW
jgi:hypothetical protein